MTHIGIRQGDTVGILGSGQLGRMLASAAARLGLRSHVYAPESGPAFDVATTHTRAEYDNDEALAKFAAEVHVITYEFENVPAHTAEFLVARRQVHPNPVALATSQDRLLEKQFLNSLGIPTAPFAQVDDGGSLARAVAQIGRPSILKTRRFGYDGKGQAMVREGADLSAVFRGIGAQPCILEGVVDFAREISVVGARGFDGSFAAWDVCENTHEHHILAVTRAPANIAPETAAQAVGMASRIAEALNYVGVIAVEMFHIVKKRPNGEVVESLAVNELAPRVHNSGHWTLDGSVTSQFEQHIRAICGWPLGSTRLHAPVEMRNLIGSDVDMWRELLNEPGVCLHLYGKREARPGRKMGHFTRLLPQE